MYAGELMIVLRVTIVMQKKIKITHLKNQSKPTDQTQQVQTNTNSSFEHPSASSGNNIYKLDDPSLKSSKNLCKKTMANKQSIYIKECAISSPNSKTEHMEFMAQNLPDKNKEKLSRSREKLKW